MLNSMSATATDHLVTADIAASACAAALAGVEATQAVKRPPAGTGTGAFSCVSPRSALGAHSAFGAHGAFGAGSARGKVVLPALPRLAWAGAVAGAGNGSRIHAGIVSIRPFGGTKQFDNSKQRNQVTRSYPINGGVGPHPAREPEPV